MKHQTIFALIPYANLYAFYRIQKLRRYLLITILGIVGSTVAGTGIVVYAMLNSDSPDLEQNLELILTSIRSLPAYLIYFSGGILLNVYLVRKWSKKWNLQLDNVS